VRGGPARASSSSPAARHRAADFVDLIIAPAVGAEVIAGSTRLKAGTATKMVLNILTTGAMVRIGKTYGNLMVDVQTGSEKLRDRARRIINIVTGLEYEDADRLLKRAHGNVKAAIVMQKTGLTTIAEARARGLSVFAWINVNLVSSAHDLPAAPSHVVNRAPEWLMVPRGLAQELSAASPDSPGFIGRLARWSRSNSAVVEGLYSSPLHPSAADHAVQVAADIARRYAIDGVHFDYVRFPGSDFDYGRVALEGFRKSVQADLSPATARALDARRSYDVLAYVDAMPER
jgi:hypothetical protein